MVVAGGIDIGREVDKTVITTAQQEDEKSVAYVRHLKVLARVPFPEQQSWMRRVARQFRWDIAVVDATGIGLETAERLKMTLPCTVWDFKFSDTTKPELMGVAYAYFTGGKVKAHPKHRQLLVEFQNIRRETTPAGNVVYRDHPHGDLAWSGALALYGLKRMVGDVGVADLSGIFRPYEARRALSRAPPGIDASTLTVAPKDQIIGEREGGRRYLIRLPDQRCPDCARVFMEAKWLELHRKVDHGWIPPAPTEEDA